MPLFALSHKPNFPPVEEAMEDGLLAIGGSVDTDWLLAAYRQGIFPWYDGDTPLWWSPDPRFVLFPENLKVSKSMQAVFKKNSFRFTTNTAFSAVIRSCKALQRRNQDGTWITDELEASVNKLHAMGFAHSAEAWIGKDLVGGLYGIRMGRLFFGESMFSRVSNASKFAFISYVEQLKQEKVVLIDCQVYTEHLESLGAGMITRESFMELIREFI